MHALHVHQPISAAAYWSLLRLARYLRNQFKRTKLRVEHGFAVHGISRFRCKHQWESRESEYRPPCSVLSLLVLPEVALPVLVLFCASREITSVVFWWAVLRLFVPASGRLVVEGLVTSHILAREGIRSCVLVLVPLHVTFLAAKSASRMIAEVLLSATWLACGDVYGCRCRFCTGGISPITAKGFWKCEHTKLKGPHKVIADSRRLDGHGC